MITILPRLENPIVRDQTDYDTLRRMLEAFAPQDLILCLGQDTIIVTNLGRRRFKYPQSPTMEWVCDRVKYVLNQNL